MTYPVLSNYNFSQNYQSDTQEGVSLHVFCCGTKETPNETASLIPKLFNHCLPGATPEYLRVSDDSKAYGLRKVDKSGNSALIMVGPGAEDHNFRADTIGVGRVESALVKGSPSDRIGGLLHGSGMDRTIQHILKYICDTNSSSKPAERKINRINASGWSRGSYIATQRLVNVIYAIQQNNLDTIRRYFGRDIDERCAQEISAAFDGIRFNLLAIDTVRGPTNHLNTLRTQSDLDAMLPNIVDNYLQIFALNETSIGFEGELPPVSSQEQSTQYYLLGLPGTHSTLIGKVGHRSQKRTLKGSGKPVARLAEHIAVDYLTAMGVTLDTSQLAFLAPTDLLKQIHQLYRSLGKIKRIAAQGHYLKLGVPQRLFRMGETIGRISKAPTSIQSAVAPFIPGVLCDTSYVKWFLETQLPQHQVPLSASPFLTMYYADKIVTQLENTQFDHQLEVDLASFRLNMIRDYKAFVERYLENPHKQDLQRLKKYTKLMQHMDHELILPLDALMNSSGPVDAQTIQLLVGFLQRVEKSSVVRKLRVQMDEYGIDSLVTRVDASSCHDSLLVHLVLLKQAAEQKRIPPGLFKKSIKRSLVEEIRHLLNLLYLKITGNSNKSSELTPP